MVTLVLVFNLLVATLCFFVAWRIWQLRKALARAANALTLAEQKTHAVLHRAPPAIQRGQVGTYELRQRYQHLERQVQTLKQVMLVLSTAQTVLSGRGVSKLRRSRRRPHSKWFA